MLDLGWSSAMTPSIKKAFILGQFTICCVEGRKTNNELIKSW
jgi:hypothetical protein